MDEVEEEMQAAVDVKIGPLCGGWGLVIFLNNGAASRSNRFEED